MAQSRHAKTAVKIAYIGGALIMALFIGLSFALKGEIHKPFVIAGAIFAILHVFLFRVLSVVFDQPLPETGLDFVNGIEDDDDGH